MALATRKKPTGKPHRQRTGKHHRHNKQYLKTYWPYLPMLMVVVVGLAINSLWHNGAVLGASSDLSDASLLSRTNSARTADQETPLSLDPQLEQAAQAKANDMVARNYWSHNTPDGRTPWSFISAAGYSYQLAGENLAYGFASAGDIINAWLSSPEHRANLLNSGYSQVGFGVASSPNFQGKGPETVVVAEYASPTPAAANITFTVPSPTGVKAAHASEPATQTVSRIQLIAGKQAGLAVAVSFVAGMAAAIFVLRHALWLRRAFARGEVFISHHPFLDLAVVTLATAGFVLSRASGVIR